MKRLILKLRIFKFQSKRDVKSLDSINLKLDEVQSVINKCKSLRAATLTCKKLWGIQETRWIDFIMSDEVTRRGETCIERVEELKKLRDQL